MIHKVQLFKINNTSRKKSITMVLILCTCCLSTHAQKMKKYLNKELRTEVATVCEETPDDNPCAGSTIYLALWFDKKQVKISEIEISTCGKESVYEIGTYNWELLYNKEISIDFIPEETKDTYAENIVLELRGQQLTGNTTHWNGQIVKHIFKEKK